jgi:hypothetical protein
VALAPTDRPSLARRVAAFVRAIFHGRDPLPADRIPEPPPPKPEHRPMKTGMVLIERADDPPAIGWLVEITGDRRGHLHVFREGHARIGSRSTDVVLDHPSVAPVHARIVGASDSFLLIAEAGAAVRVDDRPVTRHELIDGDRVTLGEVALVWKSL